MWLNVEITQCVVGADVFHHLAQELHVGRILAVFDPDAEEIAQNAAEVLMTGIAQEGAESVSIPMKLPRMPS